MEPHEELKAKGLLVEFDAGLGNAAFVSHQWVGNRHPDPESKQLRVLQDAMIRLLSAVDYLPVDVFTEIFFPRAKLLMHPSQLREAPLFIWYDYFSCPQLERSSLTNSPESGQRSKLARAIDSIPGYIARCKFFFVLCPVVESTSLGKVFTQLTWADRAWTRIERVLRELSPNQSWILIKSPTEFELVTSSTPFFVVHSAGEGQFTVEEDRTKLAQVFQKALVRKLRLLLRGQDLVAYRVLLNMQSIHLRGFPAVAEYDLIPGFEPDGGCESGSPALAAQQFLYQNGFAAVHEVDAGGWSPVHYAALRGDPLVVQGLLQMRASINRWTRKDQPMAGVPLGGNALCVCSLFKHHDSLRLLISARAKMEGGMHPDLGSAAVANDPESIRILCASGADLGRRNLFGDSAFEYATSCGTMAALEELVIQAGSRSRLFDVSRSLYVAMTVRGGSAEVVHRLLELRADVNAVVPLHTALARILFTAKSLQHRHGRRTLMSRWAYHRDRQTPLMAAIMNGHYEAAAALIAAGARMDLRNSRNWAAADFAQGQSLPDFLMQLGSPEVSFPLFLVQGCLTKSYKASNPKKQPQKGHLHSNVATGLPRQAFEGDREGCQRVAAQALANASIEL